VQEKDIIQKEKVKFTSEENSSYLLPIWTSLFTPKIMSGIYM